MSTTQKDSLKINSGGFKNIKVFKTLTQRMGHMQGIFPKTTFSYEVLKIAVYMY